jgi:hypothetical protein
MNHNVHRRRERQEDKLVLARLLGAVLQTLGVESILLGFFAYLAELWAKHEWSAGEDVPPRTFVGLADLTRTLTHTSPLIALTVLGTVLIVVGVVLDRSTR